MNRYVFYTGEGYTVSPTGKDVENLQILGFEEGASLKEAFKALLDNNTWILESGFSEDDVLAKQVYN